MEAIAVYLKVVCDYKYVQRNACSVRSRHTGYLAVVAGWAAGCGSFCVKQSAVRAADRADVLRTYEAHCGQHHHP